MFNYREGTRMAGMTADDIKYCYTVRRVPEARKGGAQITTMGQTPSK